MANSEQKGAFLRDITILIGLQEYKNTRIQECHAKA
jgi:hypothetical protein